MKLLTTGGLLYSTVQAQADGASGTYQSFDYVAMFPEGANGGLNLASTTTPINIGWDPVVVEVIANWDGGKTVAGFGKLTGTIYASWVIKMWGAKGTFNCGNDAKITGYVTMVMGLNADLGSTSANCVLTSNAKVQWAWTNRASTTLVATAGDRYSYVITSATEEYNFGGDAATGATVGDDSYIIVAGGHTIHTPEAFGLNSWSMIGEFIDYNGAVATATAMTNKDTVAWSMDLVNAAAEVTFFTTASNVLALSVGQTATNHCWTAIQAPANSAVAMRAVIGGYTGSITTCLKHAVDGYSFWGAIIMAKVSSSWAASQFTTANGNMVVTETGADTQLVSADGTITAQTTIKGLNVAQVRVIKMNYTNATYEAFILLTTSEYYYNSVLYSQKVATGTAFDAVQGNVQLLAATFGSVWNFWPFKSNETTGTNYYAAQTPDNIICVGTKLGKGALHRATVTTGGAGTTLWYNATTTNVYTVNNDSNGVVTISAPTGGMGQFKGALYGTTEQLYVQSICLDIAPMYYTTWAINLDDGVSNGWVVSCYSGIPQCEVSLANGLTPLTATQASSCLDDPRYMTWRVMNMKIDKNGTISWWRTDSYWDSSSSMFSSTWGVGVRLSVSLTSNDDNQGTTNLGKTFVFAYSDGSGVQLNHIAFGTSPPSSNNSAGSGTNTLTSAPTTFTNTMPLMVNQQMCGGSNLELSGTASTSALSSTITDWSDGYKAKVTMNLEMILPGAVGGWRGVCMVYYSSQYVMDNTNGSICFAAQVDSATGKGPTDFGAGYLMSVASSVWQPPANKASLQPSSSALTGGKYDIVYAPTSATAFMYTEGYYASVTWYQPKYASSYSGIARYGKDDYVGAFCMQGSGSNSYFGATAASVKLTGAMYLAVGVISLGTALSLAI